jgi:hypothetical protein
MPTAVADATTMSSIGHHRGGEPAECDSAAAKSPEIQAVTT